MGFSLVSDEAIISGRFSELYRSNIVRNLSETFQVRGNVNRPKLHFVYGTNRRWTVLAAIEAAGGFSGNARKDKVSIRTASGKLILVNCISAKTNAGENIVIPPGSIVYVPRRFF